MDIIETNIPGTSSEDEWPLLRPEEVAEMLSVRTSWVYEAVRARRLPCRRVGRHVRFSKQMVAEWVAEQSTS
jgi:excisionase family DNA binding protein